MATPPVITNPDQLKLADQPFTTYNTMVLVSTGIVFAVLPAVFIALRFWARRITGTSLGIDDWITVPALLITIATCVAQILCAELGGLGSHQQLGPGGLLQSYPGLIVYEKLKYVLQVVGTCNVGIIKLSVLLMYRRIFATGTSYIFTTANNILIGVVTAWTIAFTFALAFQCTPVSVIWTEFEIFYSAFCVKVQFLYLGVAISDFILDLLILLLPIQPILHLQISRKHLFMVLGIFLLGSIVVAAGIARVVIFYQVLEFTTAHPIAYFTDIQWYTSGTLFWVPIENSLALIAACLPVLRPVYLRVKERSQLNYGGHKSSVSSRVKVFSHTGESRMHAAASHQQLGSTYSAEDRIPMHQSAATHDDSYLAEDVELHPYPGTEQIHVQRQFYVGPAS